MHINLLYIVQNMRFACKMKQCLCIFLSAYYNKNAAPKNFEDHKGNVRNVQIY